MLYIIDIAKKVKEKLDDASSQIANDLITKKDYFGIGVSDADLLKDKIAFLLETRVYSLEKSETEDDGLSILVNCSFEHFFTETKNSYIKIVILLTKSNGVILKKKEFKLDRFENNKKSAETIDASLNNILDFASTLSNTLLKDYLA